MKKVRWPKILLITGGLLILGYFVFAIVEFTGKNKNLVCKKMDIYLADTTSLKLITQNEVARILENEDLNPVGKSLKRIKTEEIEHTLQKNPFIKTAECFLTPSGNIKIYIYQRCPVFQVVSDDSYYVDNDKRIIPVNVYEIPRLPVVSGRVTQSMATGNLFGLVSFIGADPFWNAQIEQIFVRDDLKIELFPRVGDAIIVLGTVDNFDKKLGKLRKMYSSVFSQIGWNRYKTIDLEYKDQIVCTRVGDEPKKNVVRTISVNDSIKSKKI